MSGTVARHGVVLTAAPLLVVHSTSQAQLQRQRQSLINQHFPRHPLAAIEAFGKATLSVSLTIRMAPNLSSLFPTSALPSPNSSVTSRAHTKKTAEATFYPSRVTQTPAFGRGMGKVVVWYCLFESLSFHFFQLVRNSLRIVRVFEPPRIIFSAFK